MKKKILAICMAALMSVSVLAACGPQPAPSTAPGSDAGSTAPAGGGELRVVSSFSATDGNRPTFEAAYKGWEAATGNTVVDESQTSDEAWKAKVLADFETGSEPDVLFFFTGADANSFVESGAVVSLEDIRAEYPDYAGNMDDGKLAGASSLVDGKVYAVPTTGYWEGMFVNKKVLADCGLEAPTADTTWEEFLAMCQTIKDKGYTPIACSLQEVPHYWFEFGILNNGGPANHLNVPASSSDASYANWVGGLNDIKDLYSKGFFPANTLTATDPELWELMYNDQAAFAIDGSWKTNQVLENVGEERLEDYTITYVPAKDASVRKNTDIIGGLSMGWYITTKAWEDPAKRDMAVSFIQALTTDDVINAMALGISTTALKKAAPAPADLNALQLDANAMMNNATSITPAVQDFISPEAKNSILITDTKLVASGEKTAEEAVDDMMALNKT